MTDISQSLKDAGFVFREFDKNHPKYKECVELLKGSFLLDLEKRLREYDKEKEDTDK